MLKPAAALAAFVAAVGIVATPVLAADAPKTNPAPAASKDAKVTPYPLKTCLVTGETLGKDAVSYVHDGQEFKFCCKPCVEKFKADPAKYHKMLKDEVAKQKKS